MRVHFTKMQGAGNDFVVLDETQALLHLSPAQYRYLAHRHFGVGADQILSVRLSMDSAADFEYVIHNADGGEVQQCGNGARCFARYVVDKALTHKRQFRVRTLSGVIEPALQDDGRVRVNMGAPVFDLARVPFEAQGLQARAMGDWQRWVLPVSESLGVPDALQTLELAVLSMGNPHVVLVVPDVNQAPVAQLGAWLESHPRFTQRVNVGWMQVLSPTEVRLRVFERGAGETLACGTGACAAVVAGRRLGLLNERVDVHTRGGCLSIEWAGVQASAGAPVFLTGPAVTVFEGVLDMPETDVVERLVAL